MMNQPAESEMPMAGHHHEDRHEEAFLPSAPDLGRPLCQIFEGSMYTPSVMALLEDPDATPTQIRDQLYAEAGESPHSTAKPVANPYLEK